MIDMHNVHVTDLNDNYKLLCFKNEADLMIETGRNSSNSQELLSPPPLKVQAELIYKKPKKVQVANQPMYQIFSFDDKG